MASLVEDLLNILSQEKDGYDRLYSLSEKKRDAIVHQKLPELEALVNKEQDVSSDLKQLEKRRITALSGMSAVLGHDDELLTVAQVIDLLDKQPKEHEALRHAREELIRSADRMRLLNEQNAILLQQAMEMVQFDLTLFKSLKQAPETANYNRGAYNTGDILPSGGFDAKQ